MLKNNDFGIYSGGTGGGGGGGVQSVTGLNTNNTDPANPIVQISVDGTTITGTGTPGSPLVATSTGTVESVTGLNTDNTDPANPIVQISVDGTTIAGAGTPASPLAITTALPVIDFNVNLSANDFDLAGAGIYRITTLDLTDTYVFNFNNTGILDGSRVVLTNSNISSIHFAYIGGVGGVSVVYQGTQQLVAQIPSGMTYEFIYEEAGTTWYCLNPTPQIAPTRIDLDAWGGTYFINTPGFFTFYNNSTGYSIELPDPAQFNGLQLVIWNQFNGGLGYSGTAGTQPVNSAGVSITSINNRSVDVLCSMDSEWLKVN